MSIGQPINPSQCNNITPVSSVDKGALTPTEISPLAFECTSNGMIDGDKLLFKLKSNSSFGNKGEYARMPQEGLIAGQLTGILVGSNGDAALLGINIPLKKEAGVLSLFIPSAYNLQAIIGTTFNASNLSVDVELIGDLFTISIKTLPGMDVPTPFNVTLIDSGTFKEIAITPKP